MLRLDLSCLGYLNGELLVHDLEVSGHSLV